MLPHNIEEKIIECKTYHRKKGKGAPCSNNRAPLRKTLQDYAGRDGGVGACVEGRRLVLGRCHRGRGVHGWGGICSLIMFLWPRESVVARELLRHMEGCPPNVYFPLQIVFLCTHTGTRHGHKELRKTWSTHLYGLHENKRRKKCVMFNDQLSQISMSTLKSIRKKIQRQYSKHIEVSFFFSLLLKHFYS